MTFHNLVTLAFAAVSFTEAAKLPFNTRGESLIGRREYNQLLRRQHTSSKIQLPDYHYANATTSDATANGMQGVIIEPDLVLGMPGKDGATVTKSKLGPYTVPAGRHIERQVPMFQPPCTNCWITAIQLGLEYPDGKIANVDTGAWCHHIDLNMQGQDYLCPTTLGSLLQFSDPAMGGKRIFSGGNERVPVRMNSKMKYGLDFGPSVRFGGVLEILNENKQPITVYLTLTWEWLDKAKAPDYKTAHMLWVDVTTCGRQSDFPGKPGIYQLESNDFIAKEDMYWLDAIGHEHDGGTHVDLLVNGEVSCRSKNMYGNRRGGYTEPTDGTIQDAMVMPAGSHISDVGVCKDWASLNKGDKIKVVAYFNDTRHMQMRTASGELDEQMGIMFTYAGVKNYKPCDTLTSLFGGC